MSDEWFEDVDGGALAEADLTDETRLETADRSQYELQPYCLDDAIPPGHPARLVWRFVEGVDLSAFLAPIRSRVGRAGRPATDPKILVALWLWATIDGVGSAREVDRLCTSEAAYRWICGTVSMNYHTLSDFRLGHQVALDQLLTQSIAVLLDKRVVTLNRIAQDGIKIRAHAGVRSFKRGERLRECLAMAKQQVRRTRAQMDGDVAARRAAAQARAEAEREAGLEAALAQIPAIEATKHRNGTKSAAKASTTDPDARVMKMADGGYRPAYNVQLATDVSGQAVVGLTVTNGGEAPELVPMLMQVRRRTGRDPQEWFADGGFVSTEGIAGVAARGTTLYMPVPAGKHAPGSGQAEPAEAIRQWRDRMATDTAKDLYRIRAATAERLNGDLRLHRGLTQTPVCGLRKVHTWALWFGLALNVMRILEIVPHAMS